MKKIFTLCFLMLLIGGLHAQAPNAFSFQGVAKGADGQVLANGASIQVRFTIHKDVANGVSVYQETHLAQVKSGGVFNVVVGNGTVVSGVFKDITWSSNPFFVQVEVDPTGGGNYADVGTTQLLSTPYALHATTADSWKQDEPIIQKGQIQLNEALAPVGTGARLIWFPARGVFRAGVQTTGISWENAQLGIGSFGTGVDTYASGDYSSAFGYKSKASGEHAAALGRETEASGAGAFAAGYKAKATGSFSAAFGSSTLAGVGALAAGSSTQAVGNYTVAFGDQTEALGAQSLAAGLTTNAIGIASAAFGISSTSRGDASFAAGEGTMARNFGSVAVGVYNDQQGNVIGTKAGASATDRIFQIGNGSSLQSTSNALTVLRNGNIGFGKDILNPTHLMDIGGRIRMRQNGGSTAGIYFDSPNPDKPLHAFVGMKANNEVGFYINNVWAFGATSAGVNVYGSLHVSGGIVDDSDRRLKKNIVGLNNSFERIQNIKGYNYHWIDEKKDKGLQTGVIAQEVEEIFPELVKTDDKGFKSVNYTGFIPHLIEAVKELKKENEQLEADNAGLKDQTAQKLKALEARLDMLSSNTRISSSK